MDLEEKVRFILVNSKKYNTYKGLAKGLGISYDYLYSLRKERRKGKSGLGKKAKIHIDKIYRGIKGNWFFGVALLEPYEGKFFGITRKVYTKQHFKKILQQFKDEGNIILEHKCYYYRKFNLLKFHKWEVIIKKYEDNGYDMLNKARFLSALGDMARHKKYVMVE